MNSSDLFDNEIWVDRLSKALLELKKVQEPYLQTYWQYRPRKHIIRNGKDETRFPLDDLRMVFAEALHGRKAGNEAQYEPLLALLDSTRHILLSHPKLERVAVAGRIIGENDFYMRILNFGVTIYARDLAAGLMARAAEVSGNGYETAARELNAFLLPITDVGAARVLGDLDNGCNILLFSGLFLTEQIDFEEGISMLPIEKIWRFVDRDLVEELAPLGAGIHGWRSIGALIKPFRWRPIFKRRGSTNEPVILPPDQFILDAQRFLNLIAVSHEAPVMPLAVILNCIDGSAARLFGQEKFGLGVSQKWAVGAFDSFAEIPELNAAALGEALGGFRNRKSANYRKMAPFVVRLANALRRDGQYVVSDKVMDVAIALEGMYELPKRGKSKTLAERVSGFIGGNDVERLRIKKTIQRFYDARSEIVHSGKGEEWPFGMEDVFVKGFSLARRSLYKFLHEGVPENWEHVRRSTPGSQPALKRKTVGD